MGREMIVRHMGWEMIVRHFRNEKATGAEMGCPIDSGIVTGDVLDSYWPIFSLSLVTVPEVFAKVNSVQFPWRLLSGEYVIFIHESVLYQMTLLGLFWGDQFWPSLQRSFVKTKRSHSNPKTVSSVVPNFKIRAVNWPYGRKSDRRNKERKQK